MHSQFPFPIIIIVINNKIKFCLFWYFLTFKTFWQFFFSLAIQRSQDKLTLLICEFDLGCVPKRVVFVTLFQQLLLTKGCYMCEKQFLMENGTSRAVLRSRKIPKNSKQNIDYIFEQSPIVTRFEMLMFSLEKFSFMEK